MDNIERDNSDVQIWIFDEYLMNDSDQNEISLIMDTTGVYDIDQVVQIYKQYNGDADFTTNTILEIHNPPPTAPLSL